MTMVTARRTAKSTTMAMAQRATLTTTMTMATARQDMTTTTMASDVDNNDDEGDDASSTGCDEGDNRNRDDGKDACASATATTQPVVRRRRIDATRQPAGANKEEGSRMDACGSCATKGDARRRHATTGDATTSRRTRDKRAERRQQTRGDGGQGCAFKGGGRVERMRCEGINTTTSRRTRDYRVGGKSDGDGNGNGECRTPPSWDLAATALVLAAEVSAALIADNADGGSSGVAIVGSASLAAGVG